MKYYWEMYYPITRDDARFLGYKTDDIMIDTRFPKMRCGACHKRAPIADYDMNYCPWCGKRMHKYHGYSKKLDLLESPFNVKGYAEKYDVLELKEE